MTGSPAANKEIVRRHFEEACNGKRPELWEDLMEESFVVHHPLMEPGRDSYREACTGYWGAFPDATVEILDLVAEDDRVAARWSERGTHSGEFMGMAPTGRKYDKEGITIFRLSNGRLAEAWLQEDVTAFQQQLFS
jgi:steroid delta-isomerase-like uncharacterized protein